MATAKATANFNVLNKDKNLNKDYRKLTKGMKILRGNRWASFFGASNYQKINRSYRRQFVQKRPDGKGGVILFDTRTQKPTNDELINQAIVENVTGSSDPTADLKYINARGRAEIQKNLGNLKDGVSLNDIFFHTRRLFSDPIYNTKGKKIGKEIDLKRNVKADQLRIEASEASLGTRYDEFLDPASPVYKGGGTEVGTMVNGQFQTGTGVVNHSAEGRDEAPNGATTDNTYLPANPPKEEIKPIPGQTDLKINKLDNKNSGTPDNSSKNPNTGEIKIEKPKHWIRTPLEHELGTDYYNSEAYKRLLRRIEKNKNKKK